MKKSTSSCLQRVVFLWLLFLVATLFFAHQWLLPRTLEPSAKIEAAQPQTENRALAAPQAPEPVDSHGGGQSGQPHLSKTNLDKEEEAEPAPVEASEARGGRSRQASFEAPLTDFDNNAPRPPPRPGDYEEYSEAPETLPGIDANHLHGRLGLRADGTPKAPAIPLPPNGLTDEERSDAHRGFCFNSRVSDSISVDRSQDDIRSGACRKLAAGYATSLPQATIVIVFHNEAFSALVRSVHSVLNTSPPHLVKEVILVDDASHPDDLRFYRKHWVRLQDELSDYVKGLPKTRLVRLKERRGLMLARMEGVWRSDAPVTIFLDSHIEATRGWIEPILARIAEDKRHVVVPSIDTLGAEDMVYRVAGGLGVLGFSWTLGQDPYLADTGGDGTRPAKSPVMAGGLFASDTREFLRLGGYDPEMRLYGGEEMEIGFRTWMCGGDIEYLPCSHVGHIFRTPAYWKGQVYKVPGEEISRNKLRTAEVWMDEYKSLVQFASSPLPASLPIGDLEPRRKLREKLRCKDFRWYLQSVTPRLFVPKISPETKGGALRNQALDACLDTLGSRVPGQAIGCYPCHGQHGTQAFVEDKSGLLRVPQLGYKMCLSLEENFVGVRPCKENDERLKWSLDSNLHIRSLQGLCLEASEQPSPQSPYTLKVGTCQDGGRQEWHWA